MKFFILFFSMLMMPVFAEEVFPLPILDALPKENITQFVNLSDAHGMYNVLLSNGMELIVSPLYEEAKDNTIDLGENYIFIKNKDGEIKPIGRGSWFGDFARTLVLDKKTQRIYIRETEEDKIIREIDLKCTKTDCAFFTDKDCLFSGNYDNPTEKELMEELSVKNKEKIYNNPSLVEALSNKKEKYLEKLFLSALSGKKDVIKFFLDRELMNKYFDFDASIGEQYKLIDVPLLKEYGKKCFSDDVRKLLEGQK